MDHDTGSKPHNDSRSVLHGKRVDCRRCNPGQFDLCSGCIEQGFWCLSREHEFVERDYYGTIATRARGKGINRRKPPWFEDLALPMADDTLELVLLTLKQDELDKVRKGQSTKRG